MTTRQVRTRRVPVAVLGVSVVLTVLGVAAILAGGPQVRFLVLAVAAAGIGGYVTTTHPLVIFGAFAAVLGFAPYVHLPGTDIPMLLVLAVGIWVALVSVPGVDVRPGWCEMWVVALAAVALLSVVATRASADSLIEYIAWVAATATVIPIRFLPSAARTMTIRVFVSGAAAASVVGMLLMLDPNGFVARALTFTGIDPDRPNVQVVAGSEMVSTRLNGTYLEANIAGFILAGALLLALAYMSGRTRAVLIMVIGAGLLLTLSRSALATVVVALVLLILRTGGRRRHRMVLAGVAGIAAAMAVPAVRNRLLDSFGPTDTGTDARVKALQDFSGVMDGHWVWGLGWDRPEFRDAALAFQANFVANTPLATVYRGGVILGLLVVVVMIALVVRSWRIARRGYVDAVLGCSIIAFMLVSLQLDYPTVTQPSATVMISMLVGLSMRHGPPPDDGQALASATPGRASRQYGGAMPGTFEGYRAIGRRMVQGWVETPTFDVLRTLRDAQDRAGVEGAVAEIGVHHGKLFIALQLLAPPGTPAVAIDVFDDQNLNVDRSGRGDLRRFEANVRRWGDWSSVVVVQADSTQLTGAEVRDFAGQPIRWFSVDGGHTKEIVSIDMRTAQDSLAAGGIVVADDVFNPEWPDVSVGTMRYLDGGGSLVPFAIGFNKTYFAHQHHAAAYRDAIRRDYAHRWRIAHQTKVFHGFEVEVLWALAVTPRVVLRRSRLARKVYEALRSTR